MKNTEVKYFSPEEEYTRFIIGRFKDESYVPSMLKEYGELCGDSPKISEYYKQEDWTIIPCPIELINRGCFLDLMSWLTKENEKAYAIAIHPNKSYCAKSEIGNMNGDTAVVVFDDGITIRWILPNGLIDDNAFFEVDPEILDGIDMIPGPCKEFLACMGADKLIEHFKL